MQQPHRRLGQEAFLTLSKFGGGYADPDGLTVLQVARASRRLVQHGELPIEDLLRGPPRQRRRHPPAVACPHDSACMHPCFADAPGC
jgi:hypothetical protein